MSLELPADAEKFIPDGEGFDHLHTSAVYVLRLSRPDDLAAAWDHHFEHRPDYWESLEAADRVLYVGSAKDLLARLTDHKDGEKRLTVLTEVCSIDGLRNVHWCETERRFLEESKIATLMNNELGDTYVHSR